MPVSAVARRVTDHSRERGVLPVVADCASWAVRWAAGRPLARRTPPGSAAPARRTFRFDGRDHAYLRHPYNYTWLNERAVEVPLAADVLAAADPGRVLEIGNVLSHYQPVRHTVVDKYERAPGVLNADVVDLPVRGPYDLVLAVSTLEHVGFDEEPRDPGKPARAVERLTSVLAPGGRLWCTFPVGYNPALDERLASDGLGFDRLTALRRTGRGNTWVQAPVEEVWGTRYDRLLYTAQAVVVAELDR